MDIEWENAQDEQKVVKIRAMFYGGMRSGKTRAASLFPRPLMLLPPNEDSITSVRGMDIMYTVLGKKDPMQIVEHTRAVLDSLLAASKTLPFEKFADKYGETIIVDNMTHLLDAFVAQETKNGKIAADQQTWGRIKAHALAIRDACWRLPMHVVFCCLDRQKTNQQGNVIEAGPALVGAAAELLPSSCDVVGYCEQVNSTTPKFIVHFRKYGAFPAGSRIVGMPPSSMESSLDRGKTIFDQLQAYANKSLTTTAG